MILFFSVFWAGISGLIAPVFGQAIVIDHSCTDLSQIPEYWLEQAKGLTLHYAHTSHGGQITSGIQNLEDLDTYYSIAIRRSSSEGLPPTEDPPALRIYDGNPPETYISPNDYWEGSSAWARTTAVAATGNYDFSMWSWCGQVSSASESYIDEYLETMDRFETWYTGMRFIYMTGHLDGSGSSGNLHQRNEQIRDYCTYYYKVLFDFADIERYDPDGVDYLDLGANDNCDYSGGNWANEWCAANPGSELCEYCSCAHSRSLNCNQKARAFWWMMARLAGWNGQTGAPTPTPAGGFTPTPPPTPEITASPTPTVCGTAPPPTVPPTATPPLPPTPSPSPTNPGSISPTLTPCITRTPTPIPVPSPTPEVTPMCSPCAVWMTGCVYDSQTSETIAGAHVEFDWISRCEEYHDSYDLPDGCFDIWKETHAAGEGSLKASAWGYQTDIFEFTGCGDYSHDFYLVLSQAPTSTPSPCSTLSTTPTVTPTPKSTPPFAGIHSGDYNGDGTNDVGIFRPDSGLWAIRGITRFYFGAGDDYPVCGDYSGDGTTSIGIFRDIQGLWAIHQTTRFYFGVSSDLPVLADYDGDGLCDIGIFRPSTGLWAITEMTRFYFGSAGDQPRPGDYSGTGTAGAGIYRKSTRLWALRETSRIYFGRTGDSPIPGDFNGDGTFDIGLFRSGTGLWAVRGVTRVYFGGTSDQPVPADYNGGTSDNIGIFRNGSGLWAIRGLTRIYFGRTGDLPVVR